MGTYSINSGEYLEISSPKAFLLREEKPSLINMLPLEDIRLEAGLTHGSHLISSIYFIIETSFGRMLGRLGPRLISLNLGNSKIIALFLLKRTNLISTSLPQPKI